MYCVLVLLPLKVNYPLCTIASKPRLPEHCVEYVKILQWPKEKPFGGEDILREITNTGLLILLCV